MKPLALIVDDEPDIRDLLEITLARMDIETISAANLHEAYRALRKHHFQLCLADMRLPDGDGIDLVREINQHYPHLPVAMITAHGNMETAIEALKAGAFDFVSKPVDLGMLRKLVETALKLPTEASKTAEATVLQAEHCPLHGDSNAMQEVRAMIAKLARSQAPVHITGESGTGKELAARWIHQLSPRSERHFVAVNCGAIPNELMESELFGHKKGAFTGAISDKKGLFQEAEGGTLFLDEVADLPLSMQVKLLRVIQEKTFRPIGSTREIPTDVRIISATHQDLSQQVKQGLFRQDLFYRLNVIELKMPALRERPEDIPSLARHLLENIAKNYHQPPPELTPEALQALQGYAFPGNVRELENILERAFALCENNRIQTKDLGMLEPVQNDSAPSPVTNTCCSLRPGESLEDYLTRIETELIQNALSETQGNKTAAAKKLGISFRSLRYRLKKLNIGEEA